MKAIFLSIFILITTISRESKSAKIEACLTNEELKLYQLIMSYRAQYGLKRIPLSKSLTLVAKTHVWDLATNQPAGGACNLHSWSNRGKWSSCCYTDDHAQAECMWNKPGELTSYSDYGFEIACEGGTSMDATTALRCWQSSAPHNNVILNQGVWSKYDWNAIGVGVYEGYAVVWFGKSVDKEGEPAME